MLALIINFELAYCHNFVDIQKKTWSDLVQPELSSNATGDIIDTLRSSSTPGLDWVLKSDG